MMFFVIYDSSGSVDEGIIWAIIFFVFLIGPIFFLPFIANASERVIFKEDRLILKEFFSKSKNIEYKNIKELTTSAMNSNDWLFIHWFNPKKNMDDYTPLFSWRYSIYIIVPEICKRAGIQEPSKEYLDKITKRGLKSKILIVLIICLAPAIIVAVMPKVSSNTSEDTSEPVCTTRYFLRLSNTDKLSSSESLKIIFSSPKFFDINSDIYVYVSTSTSEPKCNKPMRLELLSSDGKVIDKKDYDNIIPVKGKEFKIGGFNTDHKLKPDKYSIAVYYDKNQLIKKLDFEIKENLDK